MVEKRTAFLRLSTFAQSYQKLKHTKSKSRFAQQVTNHKEEGLMYFERGKPWLVGAVSTDLNLKFNENCIMSRPRKQQ